MENKGKYINEQSHISSLSPNSPYICIMTTCQDIDNQHVAQTVWDELHVYFMFIT